ncbi:MAG TPA: uridine kinase [Streptosporangiaceae bacterium]|nr:uridine kinase [Streptosporangiaceae bacterium]
MDSVAASPLSRSELVALLAGAVEVRSAGRPVRVAVDGCAASGKTTLADQLVVVLRHRGRHVIRAWVDDFLRPRAERYRGGQYSGQGCYQDAFDYPALIGRLLDPLGPGGTLEYQTAAYDRHGDTAVCPPAVKAPADAVLVLDGVFLLRPELRDRWELKIHLSVQPSEILRRGRIRDLGAYGSVEEVDRRYLSRYLPAQEIYHADDRPIEHADFIVINDDPARPVVKRRAAAGSGPTHESSSP